MPPPPPPPPHLSLDILEKIIKRIPVKSLIQFRSVCKAWKSLIDSSRFITGYNFRHAQSEHLLVRYEVGGGDTEVKYVCFVDDDNDSFPQQKCALTVPPLIQNTDWVPNFLGPEISCSSHGLFCLTLCFQGPEMAVLWNPFIRKSIAVVMPTVLWDIRVVRDVLGFGVCPDTKDPKLVKITCICENSEKESISCIPESQVMVFTLSSGEWTCLSSNQLPRKSIEFTSKQTVISRFIYWLADDWIYFVNGEYRNLIMSFDMSTEEFREVDLPDSMAKSTTEDLFISRLRESLVLLDYIRDIEVVSVWMMDHGDSKDFTKLYTINPPNASVRWTLAFRKNGEPIVQVLDDNQYCNTSLAVYEPCSEHIKDLGICGFNCFVSSYTESLLLLGHEDGHIVRCGGVKGCLSFGTCNQIIMHID